MVGHNVLISAVVRQRCSRKWRALFETIPGAFDASGSKIHLKLLYFVAVTFAKPKALLGRVGESGEQAFGRCAITALDNECAVGNGSILHGLPSFSIVKCLLNYVTRCCHDCKVET